MQFLSCLIVTSFLGFLSSAQPHIGPFYSQWLEGYYIEGNVLPDFTSTQPGAFADGCNYILYLFPIFSFFLGIGHDSQGNFYMFGGYSENSSTLETFSTNTMYFYNISSRDWLLVSGELTINAMGNYTDLGSFSPYSIPKSRESFACAINQEKTQMYVFGGWTTFSDLSVGNLDDLWVFDFNLRQWKWLSGHAVTTSGDDDFPGDYGVKGVPAPSNSPHSRYGSSGAVVNNTFFLAFGAFFSSSYGDSDKYFADIWRFDGNWTWIHGPQDDSSETNFSYVDFQTWSVNFIPRGRFYSADHLFGENSRYWRFFGGELRKNNSSRFGTNDMFIFDLETNRYYWEFGNESTILSLSGMPDSVYGPTQTFDSSNNPYFRSETQLFSGWDNDTLFYSSVRVFNFDAFWWYWDATASEWGIWSGAVSTTPRYPNQRELSATYGRAGRRQGYQSSQDPLGNLVLYGGEILSGPQSDLWMFYFVHPNCSYNGVMVYLANIQLEFEYLKKFDPYSSLCYCNQNYTLNTTSNSLSDLQKATCVLAGNNVYHTGVVNGICKSTFYRALNSDVGSDCSPCPNFASCPGGNALPICISNYYTIDGIDSDCSPCPKNADCSSKKSPQCYPGYFHEYPKDDCIKCPINGICSGEQTLPQSESGWFLSKKKSNTFVECNPPTACGKNSKCLNGYEDYMCSKCQTNYYRSDKICLPCSTGSSIGYIWILPIFILFVYVSIFMVKSILDKQSPVSIFLDFLQTSALIGSVDIPSIPQFYRTFISVLNISFFDSSQLLPPECFISSTDPFYIRRFFLLGLFCGLLLTFFLMYSIHIFWIRKIDQETVARPIPGITYSKLQLIIYWIQTTPRDSLKYIYLGGANLAVFYSYPLLIRSHLNYFDCVYLADNYFVLNEDRSQECYTGQHLDNLWYFIFILFVIGIGYPFFVIRRVFYAKNTWLEKHEKIPIHFLDQWGFLFALCKPHYAYFDILLLFRRFLVSFWVVAFSSLPETATVFVLATVGLLYYFHSSIKPYKSPVLTNSFSIFGLSLLFQCVMMVGYASYSISLIVFIGIILFSPLCYIYFKYPDLISLFVHVPKDIIHKFVQESPSETLIETQKTK